MLRANLRGPLVLAAVHAHRRKRGRYPASLTELAPEIIAAIPMDPFSDRPFRYRRSGKTFYLYSVGPDMQDDGGSSDIYHPREFEVKSSVRKGDIIFKSPE